ncbi:hypothetical protein F4805DRAFT_316057 [Annulohypoxylon moriforme]|nr:hypothetical protein F4805DRAFT_316057 [Annulohypoxylon moriforme]
MMKPGLSLLLLWSLWSTTGLGLGDFASNGNTLNDREQGDGGNEPVAVRWVVTGRNDESQLPSITTAPVIPTETLPNDSRLRARQTTADPDDADDDDDDDKPPPPPTPPPGVPNPIEASSSISSSVSASVSSSVAASVTGFFSSTLQALSAASSSAVISARNAGIAEGISSASAGGSVLTTTAASQTTAVTSTPAASATGTDAASSIADIQTSASKAVEEAQASASSSAQSAVEEAKASASAVMANVNTPQTQGSSLTPGQIGGIVISIAFISSLLSALATFLLMRRKARQQQDSSQKYEPDTLYAPRTQEPILPPAPAPRPHSLSQSIRNRLSSFHAMFGAPIMPPYRRSQSPSNSNSNSNVDTFAADIKRRPPTAEHPAIAMSHNARPLSDPVFPVSPVSSMGDQSLILQSNEPEARLQPSPPVPVIVEAAASPVPDASKSARVSAAPTRVSLAREQSISGGQRPHLVRVGSGRERSGGVGGDPLSMNPVCAEGRYDVAPVSATGQCHMVFPMPSPMEGDEHGGWRTSAGTEMSSTPSFQVQAPIPRRLVDPVSLESGPNYLPHAY